MRLYFTLWLLFSCTVSLSSTVFGATCSSTIAQGSSESCDTIVKGEITWTFDTSYTCGQYISGDYWCIDGGSGVTVDEIDPPSVWGYFDPWAQNAYIDGSVLNPYINRAVGYFQVSGSLNAEVTPGLPLTLNADDVLIKSIYEYKAGGYGQLSAQEILTIVGSQPASGAFRPGFADTSVAFNESDINYSALENLTPTASTPSFSSQLAFFAGPHISHSYQSSASQARSHDNYGNAEYGRDHVEMVGRVMLLLNTSGTNGQKRDLLVQVVQAGIDAYSTALKAVEQMTTYTSGDKPNQAWMGDGAIQHGYKQLILFAGAVLGSSDMLTFNMGGQDCHDDIWAGGGVSDYTRVCFVDDTQIRYVDSFLIAYNSDYEDCLGMAEWCSNVGNTPCNFSWTAAYRPLTGPGAVATALAMQIMGLRGAWGYEAYFDYAHRYYNLSQGLSDPNGFPDYGGQSATYQPETFVEEMWDAYWAAYGYATRFNQSGTLNFNQTGQVNFNQ